MSAIYLDYQASTPVDPRVVEAMLPLFTESYGNPHSTQHGFGTSAAAEVERARRQVADLIGARPSEIVFTSGATESNNQAILGVARASTGRRRIVTSTIEHPCVSACFDALEADGYDAVRVPVDPDGIVDMQAMARAINDDTLLVSVMAANNEIGTLQPVEAIGELCRRHGALLHTDAAQAVGKVHLDVEQLGVDLLGLTGHKLYGPKGAGALYVRARQDLAVAPLIIGGGQERGMRSGTVAAPLAVGLGAACAMAADELDDERQRLTALRDHMLGRLVARVPGLRLIGHPRQRLPGNLNVYIPGRPAAELLEDLPGLALSSASACAAGGGTPSHVLSALGLTPEQAQCCFRIGLGRYTTPEEVDTAVDQIADAVAAHAEVAGSR